MREVWYSVAMSLDGYIAGRDGEYDWIPQEPGMDWAAFMKRFDTVLMGRRTYEVVASQPALAEPDAMRTYVFSRTLEAVNMPGATLVEGDAARWLRQEDGARSG